MRRCTFPGVKGDDGPCGRALLGGVACPVHDHGKCSCGLRLTRGTETNCPKCNADVRLQARLK